jgi:hypothetical protein
MCIALNMDLDDFAVFDAGGAAFARRIIAP